MCVWGGGGGGGGWGDLIDLVGYGGSGRSTTVLVMFKTIVVLRRFATISFIRRTILAQS